MSNENGETSLFIGVNPKKHGEDIIASFTGEGMIPISWYFLFSPKDVKIRREEFPEQISEYDDDSNSLDELEQFMEDPVVFKTSLHKAKVKLSEYRSVFRTIPYLWSYFKVIDILDTQLENFIEQLETQPEPTIVHKRTPHPETQLSQVDVKESQEIPTEELDNPFAALEDFGQEDARTTSAELIEEESQFGLGDSELLSALEEAAELDFTQPEEQKEVEKELEEAFMPIIVYFDNISSDGRGKRLARIPVLLERLMHHARREEEMTRVMQDLMQEIFRDALSGWRITGQLAEDYVHGNPAQLTLIMIGDPSPFVIIDEKLDLEYWTKGTLQTGDERLMYSLTMLPSEQIHIAIKSGRLPEISDDIGNLLATTQSVSFPRITTELLSRPTVTSNIWGFRVLIQDLGREFKPATLLISDPSKSWKQEFQEKIKLPGVLEDWNIDLPVRFEEFSDIDHYQIVFEGAKDLEDTFAGFVRWIRRHHIMYRQKFGVEGTILELKRILEETSDKQQGQLVFDILTNLTELGFNTAIDALSDDAVVRKLPWLYS